MQTTPRTSDTPEHQKKPRKKPSLLLITVILGTIGLIGQLLWVNWPKPTAESEPLATELNEVIDRLPGTSDALIYLGLEDIRQSGFWQEALPDSIKQMNWLQFDTTLTALARENGFRPAQDIDTLLVQFQHRNSTTQDFLGIVWGDFPDGFDMQALEKRGRQATTIAGQRCAGLRDDLWICRPSERMVLLGSSSGILSRYLQKSSSFLERDSTTAALIEKAAYKSHLWFTLSSTNWTIGALQSLTSANKDLQTLGNLNRIRQLVLSLKLDDGIEGQSEWIYENRRSAYFASTFLWSALKLSSTPGTRTPPQIKQLLDNIDVMQNLESVMITADLPPELFSRNPDPASSSGTPGPAGAETEERRADAEPRSAPTP
ncbi:hypothetical protein [Prosthecochloris sp. ZM_2]|uniref:hypothetical protein n=1 Tax=Prosthecochloris sp. ZM_2 TaxID=2045206 RepID=UPI0018F4392A|nr:hypothetical protein [Prosthecochloris sp. ZM_2]